jgi:glycosyltransferase involved in cell wall biosynthesis
LSLHPTVTIIALCFNQGEYLEYTLNSIINQNYPSLELIIIDDASSDNSVSLIKEWKNKQNFGCELIIHHKNLGLCKSINEGLRLSNGKYFQVIACDDIIFQDKIETQVKKLEADSMAAFSYSDAYLMNDKGNWVKFGPKFIQSNLNLFEQLPENLFHCLIKNKNFIPAPSALVRRSFVDEVGGYDESLTFEDYDMWLRLSRKYNSIFIDQPTCLYRVHEKNMTKDLRRNNNHLVSQFNLLSKHIGVSSDLDISLEEKLYAILKQLMYNNYPGLKDLATNFYKRFNQDSNFRDACRSPVMKNFLYRVLNKIRKPK